MLQQIYISSILFAVVGSQTEMGSTGINSLTRAVHWCEHCTQIWMYVYQLFGRWKYIAKGYMGITIFLFLRHQHYFVGIIRLACCLKADNNTSVVWESSHKGLLTPLVVIVSRIIISTCFIAKMVDNNDTKMDGIPFWWVVFLFCMAEGLFIFHIRQVIISGYRFLKLVLFNRNNHH